MFCLGYLLINSKIKTLPWNAGHRYALLYCAKSKLKKIPLKKTYWQIYPLASSMLRHVAPFLQGFFFSQKSITEREFDKLIFVAVHWFINHQL